MEMRIYVANLAAYNAGYLVGEWIDLPLEQDELRERIQKILDAWNDGYGPSEEWAIHDYELPFEIGEYTSPYKVNEWVKRIEDVGVTWGLIEGFMTVFSDIEEVLDIIEQGDYRTYKGCSNMAEVAEKFYDELYDLDRLPSEIKNNINWESIGEYMEALGIFIYLDDSIIEVIR